MAKNIKVDEMKQDEIGNTVVTLIFNELRQPVVQLIHNYKKRGSMSIRFIEDQTVYNIPSRKELEDIYRIYIENRKMTENLRTYCENSLEKK